MCDVSAFQCLLNRNFKSLKAQYLNAKPSITRFVHIPSAPLGWPKIVKNFKNPTATHLQMHEQDRNLQSKNSRTQELKERNVRQVGSRDGSAAQQHPRSNQ